MAKPTLNIMPILEFLDQNNFQVYDCMREDPNDLKEFQKNIHWLIPVWMTCSSKPQDHEKLIENFNKYCNVGWGKFYYHPELQAKLLALVGLGRKTRHSFIKPGASKPSDIVYKVLDQVYPGIRQDEIDLWKATNSVSDFIELMNGLGFQDEEREAAEKILKKEGWSC